jgi:predicted glutamine amidotransferase
MARLFGLLGGRSSSPSPWLTTSPSSLLVQSNSDPAHLQRDGWGIGWYDKTRSPRIERGIGGIYEELEKERFIAASNTAHGPVVIAHIRSASNPMNLPRERLVALENSQPFSFEGSLFAHNGMISLPRETRPHLGKFERNVRGVNDSEILFWLLMRNIEELGDPLTAFTHTRDELVQVWKQHGKGIAQPYTGLNIIVTRGPNELWEFCHYLGEHGTGLCDKRHPFYEMCYRTDAKQLIVASEPFDPSLPDWRPLHNGEYLVGHLDHGLVAVETGNIPK